MNDSQISEYSRLLLGCYLQNAPISEAISASVFQSEAHKAIFTAIRELKTKGIDPDIAILTGELSNKGLIDKAGGYYKIASLTNGAYPSNVAFYEAEALREYQRRTAMETVIELKESLENSHFPDIESAIKKLSEITTTEAQKERGILFSDLLKKQFPPDTWFIENLIGPGLTVLTGASKLGKSWTALQLLTALDQGGYFMGTLKAAVQCDVLYLALEDTPKRIQRRILKQGIAADFNGSRLETSRCTVSTLRAYLKANPQYRVVIIDTLQKMLNINDLNDYAKTVDGLSALKAIADDMDLALVVIHHNRKGSNNEDGDHMESALGSTGINATADATITMRRKRGTNEAALSVTGRDIEDASYSISWDREICTWTITGQGALKPILTETQQQIISLLESEEKDWTTGEIKEGIEKSGAATSNLLKRLQEIGCIESPSHGKWRIKDNYTNSHTYREREFVNSAPEHQKAPAGPDSAIPQETEPEIW